MTASDYQTFAFALKQRYTEKKIEDLTLDDCPLRAMMTKDEDLQGEGTVIPLIHANPQGVSGGGLAAAQSAKTNIKGKKFLIEPGTLESAVSITDKVMSGSRANPGAFLRARAAEIDGLHVTHGEVLNAAFWGNGGLSIGRIGSISTNTITLLSPQDIINFEEGMTIQVSANDGTDVAHALRAGSTTVVSVNREAGAFTADDLGDITGEAANDYIFRGGTFLGNTGNLVTHGVQSFIYPTSSPPALYGMTRTSDPQRLAGCRIAASELTGMSIEDRLKHSVAIFMNRYKAKGFTHVFMNPEDWQNLEIELNAKGVRRLEDSSTRFGFEALECSLGGKMAKVYADRYCPKSTAFPLRLENWTQHSMEKMIHPIERDGLTLLRSQTANEYEYRLVSYPGLSCNAPGWSGRIPL